MGGQVNQWYNYHWHICVSGSSQPEMRACCQVVKCFGHEKLHQISNICVLCIHVVYSSFYSAAVSKHYFTIYLRDFRQLRCDHCMWVLIAWALIYCARLLYQSSLSATLVMGFKARQNINNIIEGPMSIVKKSTVSRWQWHHNSDRGESRAAYMLAFDTACCFIIQQNTVRMNPKTAEAVNPLIWIPSA